MILFHTKEATTSTYKQKGSVKLKTFVLRLVIRFAKGFLKCLQIGLIFSPQKYPVQQIRPWGFNYRNNQTYRPTIIDLENEINKTVSAADLAAYHHRPKCAKPA